MGRRNTALTRRSALARVALAVLVALALATLLALGTWQVQRLQWKEALIAAASERPAAPAVAAPGPSAWPDFSLPDWNYARVRLTGEFGEGEAYAWTVLSDPSGRAGGEGAFILAPFTTEDGWSVIVNRGFVPKTAREAGDDGWAAPEGRVSVEGLVRRDDPPNWFTPPPEPSTGTVYTRDIKTLTAFFALDPARTAPYSVDLAASETPPNGLPQAGESRVTFTNNHLQYAITWYGLALALVGVVAASLLRRRHRAPRPAAPH